VDPPRPLPGSSEGEVQERQKAGVVLEEVSQCSRGQARRLEERRGDLDAAARGQSLPQPHLLRALRLPQAEQRRLENCGR